MIKKIITHAGDFHADEVSAVALLMHVYNIPLSKIERKFEITQEEFNDPEILVIDIGRQFDLDLGNLDHHQDANSSASNILVIQYLVSNKDLDFIIAQQLQERLFNRISDIDRGLKKSENWEFSSLIKLYPTFDIAVEYARFIIKYLILNIEKSFHDQELFQSLRRIGNVAITQTSETIINWREMAEEAGIDFLVGPSERGGFVLITRDSELFNIPPDEFQTFRHNSGFLASYKTETEAIEAGLLLKKSIPTLAEIQIVVEEEF